MFIRYYFAVFTQVDVLYCPAQSAAASNRKQGIKTGTLACFCHLRLHVFAGTTQLEKGCSTPLKVCIWQILREQHLLVRACILEHR